MRELLREGLLAVMHIELREPEYGGETRDLLRDPIASRLVYRALRGQTMLRELVAQRLSGARSEVA